MSVEIDVELVKFFFFLESNCKRRIGFVDFLIDEYYDIDNILSVVDDDIKIVFVLNIEGIVGDGVVLEYVKVCIRIFLEGNSLIELEGGREVF